MFRALEYTCLVASVVASIAIGPAAYAQGDKERDLPHQFEVTGDRELVIAFEKAYAKGYEFLDLAEFCESAPKISAKEDRLLITCKPSPSTVVIRGMARVFAEATKNLDQKSKYVLTMTVSSD